MIMRAFLGLAALALASACTPSLMAESERGGIVTDITRMQPDAALAVANAHCAKYGRVARISGGAGDSMMFDCVEPAKNSN